MIRTLARGLGVAHMGDPMPGPGVVASLSGQPLHLGAIQLVASLGQPRWATYREVYLTNPWVWAAVNVLSRGAARLPLHVFALDENGRKQRQRGDLPGQPPGRPAAGAALAKLLASPTPGVSRNAAIGATFRDRLIYGNALWRIDRLGAGGNPVGLPRVPWRQLAKVHQDADERPTMYELRRRAGDSDPQRLLPADVIHFGLASDDGAVGVSPLESCRYTLALHDAVVRHLIAYFANSARLSGHLQVERLTRDKAREIRDAITEMYASPENAGKVMVTSGKWESIADSPDHAQVVELVQLSREEVAAAYAVPPPVLGILDRAIKSNVKELREQYVRDSIGPLASDFEAELQAQLLARMPGWASLFVEFQLAEQLRPDLEARALVYQRLMACGWTWDEIRTYENMPALDLPGLSDVPWVPSGQQPASAWVGGPPQPKPSPNGSGDPGGVLAPAA